MSTASDFNYMDYQYSFHFSEEDGEWVGLCAEFESLSHLDTGADAAAVGIIDLVIDTIRDLEEAGEEIPIPLKFRQSNNTSPDAEGDKPSLWIVSRHVPYEYYHMVDSVVFGTLEQAKSFAEKIASENLEQGGESYPRYWEESSASIVSDRGYLIEGLSFIYNSESARADNEHGYEYGYMCITDFEPTQLGGKQNGG